MALLAIPSRAAVEQKKKLTEEQAPIVASSAPFIVVNAYAGTGKTSTLKFYTESRPKKKFLYVAFNKALQIEAERKFGENTLCRTTHALAFPDFGRNYVNKLGNIKAIDIARKFSVSYDLARQSIDTVHNYLASTQQQLSDFHVRDAGLSSFPVNAVVDVARKTWADMMDVDGELLMPHDGYLKLYANSLPDLSRRFDTILFDEAQDANPVTNHIIRSQKRAQIVMVGDRFQSIYAFRGARNAMEQVEAEAEKHYLTRSFRFGKGIALVASRLLQDFRGATKSIVGAGQYQDTRFIVAKGDPYTKLCRTNGMIFRNAVDFLSSRTPLMLVGGVDNYNFESILDMYRLFAGQKKEIRDAFIKKLESFEDAAEYAEQTEDAQLRSMIKVVEEYRHDIPRLYERLKTEVLPDTESGRKKAHVTMTTAHRSKGLEWKQVVLENDFSDLVDDKGDLLPVTTIEEEQEINLLYVAITRAEQALEPSAGLMAYLNPETLVDKKHHGHRRSQSKKG